MILFIVLKRLWQYSYKKQKFFWKIKYFTERKRFKRKMLLTGKDALLILWVVFAMMSSGMAAPKRFSNRGCGVAKQSLEKQSQVENKISKGNNASNGVTAVQIQVHFHVIYSSGGVGRVSLQQITNQINVLQADHGSKFKFVLNSTTFTLNDDWFNNTAPGTAQQDAMKKNLHKGRSRSLNIYTVGFSSGSGAGLLGYASFPWSYKGREWDDGVVVLYSSLPGGDAFPYNQGRTATHEVGHWFGLYHTFEGGCSGNGDYVDDTPFEASPAFGCPVGRDSCTGKGKNGVDPISNFMDYTEDACMTNYTPGQFTRMQKMLTAYRTMPYF